MDSETKVVLTNTQLRKISETAAKVAIETYQQEVERIRQEYKDKRLYNTRLLMEKYKGLKRYCDEAVYNASQIGEDEVLKNLIELISRGKNTDKLTVETIQERAVKTRVIIAHIDKMLEFYEHKCISSGKQEIARKWETVYHLYLADREKTVVELANLYCVDERTIYRYNKAALQDISALLFGCIE